MVLDGSPKAATANAQICEGTMIEYREYQSGVHFYARLLDGIKDDVRK